jgi:hypothetical protein
MSFIMLLISVSKMWSFLLAKQICEGNESLLAAEHAPVQNTVWRVEPLALQANWQ